MKSNVPLNNNFYINTFPPVEYNPIHSDENIFILETILESFIPLFREINNNFEEKDNNKNLRIIQDLILFISNVNNHLNCKNKKKKIMYNVDSNIKYEEKEFLYKTYISSSDRNDGSFKFFCDDTLKINIITSQMVRGLLILIKEELSNTTNTTNTSNSGSGQNILLEKLKNVKKIIINENKAFDFKLLFILLNFIILKFCTNLQKINFEGIFYSRIDQVEIMIKNGIYLYFIYKSKKFSKYYITNKIEFLNENVAFKHLHEYCYKNNVTDVNVDSIEFNRINIFTILMTKNNIKSLRIHKISIDKNSMINSLIEIIKNNKNLQVLKIDRFISIPDSYRKNLLNQLNNLITMEKLKINIMSSTNSDLLFLNLPKNIFTVKNFSLSLSRINVEINDNNGPENNFNIFNFHKTNLMSLSLKFDKFSLNFLNEKSLCNMLPKNLREISIGLIDHIFLEKFIQLSPEYMLNLKSIKFSFLPITDEQYENSYKNILTLLEVCKSVQNFKFNNLAMKYKHICDDEIRNILKENKSLRKLIIRSDLPFHVQYIEGLYYYDYPKFLITPFLFCIKNNQELKKIYNKKIILSNLLDFHRIKKEKVIVVSYKI
jgi:hypothetical protein